MGELTPQAIVLCVGAVVSALLGWEPLAAALWAWAFAITAFGRPERAENREAMIPQPHGPQEDGVFEEVEPEGPRPLADELDLRI